MAAVTFLAFRTCVFDHLGAEYEHTAVLADFSAFGDIIFFRHQIGLK